MYRITEFQQNCQKIKIKQQKTELKLVKAEIE